MKKSPLFNATLLLLCVLVSIPSCSSFKPNSKISEPVAKLYGMPKSMQVEKGTEIKTKAGIVVVPEDTVLWSMAAFEEQVRKVLDQ